MLIHLTFAAILPSKRCIIYNDGEMIFRYYRDAVPIVLAVNAYGQAVFQDGGHVCVPRPRERPSAI